MKVLHQERLNLLTRSKAVLRSFACASALLTVSGSAFGAFGERSVGFDASSYFYAGSMSKDSFFPSLTGRFEGETTGNVLQAAIEADASVMLKPGSYSVFYEARQAYVGTSPEMGSVRLFLGRKLESWNHLDDQWRMGIWQPRFRWDYLHPDVVGLTGAFVEVRHGDFHFSLMGSPIFIPERGVTMTFQNGSVISQSPWFLPPPSQISLFNSPTPINYNLALPNLKELLLRPSVSLKARYGQEKGAWGSVALAHKPMNQLLMAYSGYFQHESEDQQKLQATVYPRSAYHYLMSLEGGYSAETMSGWASLLWDRPMRDTTPWNWTTQEVAPAVALSATVDFQVGGTKASPTMIDVSALHVWGGNAPDQGPFTKSSGSVFDTRYPFEDAIAVGVKGDVFPIARQMISGSARLIQDIGHQGTILSAELKYRPAMMWEMAVGVDVLGSNAVYNAGSGGSDFISRYRGNDRFHAGVSYVF